MHTKKFTLLLWILIVGNTVSAQRFSGGFYAGIVGSQIDGDQSAGYNKGGINLAATVQYPIADKFFMSLDLGFAQKGAQSKTTYGVPRALFINVNYVDVPLCINFYDRQHVGLTAGLQYSRTVGAIKQEVINLPNSSRIFGLDTFENDDVQVILGGTYYFMPKLNLNIRYGYSLFPMGYSRGSLYKNNAAFNNVIQIRLGFILGQEFDEIKNKKK
jgi:hypothetical protein